VPLKDNSRNRKHPRRRSPIKAILIGVTLLLLLSGCQDRSYVNVYDKNLSRETLPCLSLRVFPPDPEARRTLRSLYPFRSDCPYTLQVATKAGIHCNSNANVPQKVTSNFPSAYLRMELRRGMKLLYSYYIDLTEAPGPSELEAAFQRLEKDVHLKR